VIAVRASHGYSQRWPLKIEAADGSGAESNSAALVGATGSIGLKRTGMTLGGCRSGRFLILPALG
jgi:hypothetical protein